MDQLFHRRPEESAADWHARLNSLDPVQLTCLQRQRRSIWLEMARQALRRDRRSRGKNKGQADRP